MGRRSVHSPDELRQLILDAAQSIIERNGIAGLSAREIARLIGYSPGTIYNTFENLDDVLINVQISLLRKVVETLSSVPKTADACSYFESLIDAYVCFALDNRRLWNLLFAHTLPAGIAAPKPLHDQVNSVSQIVIDALKPIVPALDTDKLGTAARALWAGIHGITAIAVTEKGPHMTTSTAQLFAKELAVTFITGLKART